jgi:hypothetical protein
MLIRGFPVGKMGPGCSNIAVKPLSLGDLKGKALLLPQKNVFQGIKLALWRYNFIFVGLVFLAYRIGS